jgi:hypothetical protein
VDTFACSAETSAIAPVIVELINQSVIEETLGAKQAVAEQEELCIAVANVDNVGSLEARHLYQQLVERRRRKLKKHPGK